MHVVLPAPFGPSSANTSPRSTSKLTSSTALTFLYDLRRLVTLIADIAYPLREDVALVATIS